MTGSPLSIADALRAAGASELDETVLRDLEKTIYDELEWRVGSDLAARCTEQQLDEFEALIDVDDDEGIHRFMTTNLPDYRDVVDRHLTRLIDLTMHRLRDEGFLSRVPAGSPAR